MQRRDFFRYSGAATAAAVGGAWWYAYDEGVFSRTGGPAFQPWTDWDSTAPQTPLHLLQAAILAASPHNTQPWRFRVAAGIIEIYLEIKRSVAGLDPLLREAHSWIGCALENMALAAAACGYSARVELMEGKLGLDVAGQPLEQVARIELSVGQRQRDKLYAAITRRHTNRSVYDRAKPLPANFQKELNDLCDFDDVRFFLFSGDSEMTELVRISSAANLALYSDASVEAGSQEWIRWRESDIQQFRDGLTIDTFGLSPFMTAVAKLAPLSMLKRAAAPSERSGLYAQQMQSAGLIGIITVRDRLDKRQSLQAGRLWQRAHLFATSRAVAARPCNEAIELIDYEYAHGHPPKRLAALKPIIGDASWQPTFLFLMGHPTLESGTSPRRSIQQGQLPA